jgi:membrane associated rhomboid family serine protease/Zn-finger nucleic acid-binding protein
MVGLATLRKESVDSGFRSELWRASSYAGRSGKVCPHCRQTMQLVRMPPEYGGLELDVCRHCQAIWFDPSEYEQVPHGVPVARRVDQLPVDPRAREAAAMMDLKTVQARQEAAEEHEADTGAIAAWKWIPGLFGMPVEINQPTMHTRPWITWGLGAVLAAVFLLTMSSLESAVKSWGFLPQAWSRHAGLTVLTSFFLHGGLLHLAGNLYFFLVFGDNVEDHLGKFKFVLLLIFSHLAGMVLHGVLDPRGDLPLVGASAGISGVIAFYAIAFPRTRLGLLFFLFFWLRLPAIAMLLLYAGLQVLGALTQIEGFGSVSNLGHLGGLVIGVLAALIWRSRQREGREPSRDRYFKDYRRED